MRNFAALLIFVALNSALPGQPAAAVPDPVADFLAGNSAERAADLAGAAAAQLVEEALQAHEAGQTAAADSLFARAAGLAAAAPAEASALAQFVATAGGWDETALARRRAAKDLEAQADAARRGGEPEAAVKLLQEAERAYAELGDTHSQAVVWGTLGVAHWARQDWDAVRSAYERALALRVAVGYRILEGRTLNGLGSVEFTSGRVAEALAWYERAAEVRRRTGDVGGLGTSLAYAANCRLQLGDLAGSQALLEEALPALEQVGRPVPLVEALNSLGNLEHQAGRYESAAARYEQALGLCAAAADCPYGPLLLVNLGMTRRYQGRLPEAEDALAAAGALVDETAEAGLRVQFHRERGLTAMALGDRDAARDDLVAAVEIAREAGDRAQQCDGLVNLGTLYLQLDAVPQSLQAAEQARALAAELGDAVRQRDAVRLAGLAHLRAGAWASAAERYAEARDGDKEAGAFSAAAYDEIGLAGALGRLGRRDEARAGLHRALALFERTGRPDEAWAAHLTLGDTFEDERPDSAVWHYDRALALLERAREEAGGARLTGWLFSYRGRALEEVAHYYARRHQVDPRGGWDGRAWETVERARARGLRAAGAAASPPPAGAGGTAPVANLQQMRRALGKRTVLLEYAVGDTVSLLFVVTRQGARIVELPGRAALREEVRLFRDAMATPGAGDAALLALARRLGSTLVGPAAGELEKARELVIAPDDALWDLPFEALLLRDPLADAGWSAQPLLAREFAPVYAPAGGVWLALAQRGQGRIAHDLGLLALGDPELAGRRPWGRADLAPLPALPAARDEVVAIGALAEPGGALVLTGAEASEAALRELIAARRPRIVHLAAHGLVDPAAPERSCLALAARAAAAAADGATADSAGAAAAADGDLRAAEIAALPLAGTLVVLSACESARGRIERGEGVIGLTRAFLAAGARGVVASLWPVADASTARLMREFHARLAGDRLGAAAAMAAARRTLLEGDGPWSHPYYWAPFVVTGDARAPW